MDFFISTISEIIVQGLIYGLIVLGIYISFNILRIPDITVDGSFPLGAAVAISLITTGINPWVSTIVACLAGLLAGLFTGFMNVILKINAIFAGIISMTMLYSINLFIAGSSNVSVFDKETIFTATGSLFERIPNISRTHIVIIISLSIVIFAKVLLDLFLETRTGLTLRASGDNPTVVKSLGVNPGYMTILGLGISNALVALSGAILSQEQSFFEISMGTGTMTLGLASVIIGIVIFGRLSVLKTSTAILFGSIIYKALVSLAINLGAPPYMLNLVRGILFLVILFSYQLLGKNKNMENSEA